MGAIEPVPQSRTQVECLIHHIRGAASALVSAVLVGCGASIPADFAPDPELVSRIDQIRMTLSSDTVCPGNDIEAAYEAVLDDGTVVPFVRRYDADNPPALHLSFLNRSSDDASAKGNGGWETAPDPLETIMRGFRLRAVLGADTSLMAEAVVVPTYECTRHAYEFAGADGRRGRAGRAGPDVVVRADILDSPFHDQLFVASVEVGEAPPVHVVAHFESIPPSDWLRIASRGGQGGRGVVGAAGEAGATGSDGCPAGNGGAGGAGGVGGPGGAGGEGGRITLFVPEDRSLLAGLIETRVEGGPGGQGGKPGKGGAGGEGGEGMGANRRVTCDDGDPGPAGPDGSAGPRGPNGSPGPRPQIIPVPFDRVFGDRAHPNVTELIDFNRNRRRERAPGNGLHS